ncbi:MAG: hypothetical protein JWR07_271, partial [Nevskia sp.]|nr:hypothetical protein [Nevskia sp.]
MASVLTQAPPAADDAPKAKSREAAI